MTQAQPSLIPSRQIRIPHWMPEPWREKISGRTVSVEISRPIRLRARRPVKIPVSEWADRYRVVTDGAHTGPWRTEFAPHTKHIMDTFGQPWVREVWLCKVEQSGGTNTLLNCLLWGIDCDPGDAFLLLPTEAIADKVVGQKLKPTLQQSPRAAQYLSRRADETSMARIALTNGMTIYPAHANSPSSMATFTAKYAFGDEVDKYPAMAGREADPITLIRKRGRNFKGKVKRYFGSTPAGMFIHSGMMNCHQRWEWRVRCPDCGELIRMDADYLLIPEEATPETADRHPIAYACNGCGSLWDESARESAIRGGRWICVAGEDNPRPARVGYHHRAWECLDVPLHEIAAAWLRKQSGDLSAAIAWANGYEAEDYRPETAEKPALEALADRAESYPAPVPMGACLLTAGVDVQKDRIEVEVVGWGPGAESWGIDYQVLYGDTLLPAVWDELDSYLMQRWLHGSGQELPLARVFVDDGFRNNMVYKFTGPRLARGIFACKGASVHHAPEVRGPSQVRHGNVKVRQFTVGGNRLKTALFGYLALANPGPGFCHLPDTYPAAWYEMLQAEHLVTRTVGSREVSVWEKVKPGARNESIDLRQYALAAFLSMRVDLKRLAEQLKKAAEEAQDETKKKRTFTQNKGVRLDD